MTFYAAAPSHDTRGAPLTAPHSSNLERNLDHERVVLVDEHDAVLGDEEKLAVHVSGALHRAFSIFVFDVAGAVLLQQRAGTKYHSAGLWSNTCCGHPRPGERVADAAARRLREELRLTVALAPAGRFVYRAALGNGLTEHELDHLFVGHAEIDPVPDPAEVVAWRWTAVKDVQRDLDAHPERYTAWLRPALAALARGGRIQSDNRSVPYTTDQ